MVLTQRGFVAAYSHCAEPVLMGDGNEPFRNRLRRVKRSKSLGLQLRSVTPAEGAVHVTAHAVCSCDTAVEPISTEPVIFPLGVPTDVHLRHRGFMNFPK